MKKLACLCVLILSTFFFAGCMNGGKETFESSPSIKASQMNLYTGSDGVFYNEFKELFDEQKD